MYNLFDTVISEIYSYQIYVVNFPFLTVPPKFFIFVLG